MSDVRHPGGMEAEQIFGCKTSGWNVGAVPYPDVRHSSGMSAELKYPHDRISDPERMSE